MSIKAVIFDWDGTLVDSESHIVDSLLYAADCVGYEPQSRKQMARVIGLAMDKAVRALFGDVSDEELARYKAFYSDHFFNKKCDPSWLFDGVIETLDNLKASGLTLAIATGKARKGLDIALDSTQLRHYFTAHRCADETASKPDPAMLYQVLRDLGLNSDEAVMIGDTTYDLEMAKNAAMTSIGVSYGVHGKEVLAECSPVCIIDSITDLPAALGNIG